MHPGREHRAEKSVTYPDIRRALDLSSQTPDEKDLYIRDCFDNLFYFMSLFQHYTESTLILHEDVEVPLDYYIALLAKLRPVVDHYLGAANVGLARPFLETYPAWKTPGG